MIPKQYLLSQPSGNTSKLIWPPRIDVNQAIFIIRTELLGDSEEEQNWITFLVEETLQKCYETLEFSRSIL